MNPLNKKKLIFSLGIFANIFVVSCSSDSNSETGIIEEEGPSREKDTVFFRGTTMGFANHLESFGNIVYKENGIAKDPYQSLFDHGANMVRFRVDLPPYANQNSSGYPTPDFRSTVKVKAGMQQAKNIGLNTLLTFSFRSMALDPEEALNSYVAPLAWQDIASDLDKLEDSVYRHTYTTLKDYVRSGLVPKIVCIGNETNWRIMEPNLPENKLLEYKPERTVTLLNAGSRAIEDINEEFKLSIRSACHIFGGSNIKWWLGQHKSLGLEFDIMALSHYHAWHELGDFKSWTELVKWLKQNHEMDFLILETAQLFNTGGNDARVDILGLENIPDGYENPPTTNTQKNYLNDFARELLEAGALGILTWGGEWVGSDCLIYPDEWGAGSSWENKAFWDFDYNLHDGVNWMNEFTEK